MKKLLGLLLFLGLSFTAQSQNISKNALGLRLASGNKLEASYQRAIKKNNRLEFDLGWDRNSDNLLNRYQITGIYDWVWNIDGGFNWYAGAGAAFGNAFDGYYVDAAGNIGIEYDFKIPLQISLDYRPHIGLVNNNNNDTPKNDYDNPRLGGSSFGLGVRFQF